MSQSPVGNSGSLFDGQFLTSRTEALFRTDADGDLLQTNGLDRHASPALFLTVGVKATIVRFRAGFPKDVRERVEEHLRRKLDRSWALTGIPASLIDELRVLVSGVSRVLAENHGPLFAFADGVPDVPEARLIEPGDFSLVQDLFPQATPEAVEALQPFLAMVEGGRAVSTCFSARGSALVHEAGVDTMRQFRRRQLGRRVCAAWANAVRRSRAIPVYSTSFDNHASLALARGAGLIPLGVDLHFTVE